MLRYVKLYSMLWIQTLQAKMEYKFDFVLGNITTILGQVVGIAFVWVIFERIGDLNGWTLGQIMLIYGISALPYGICMLFFNGLWRLNAAIRLGTFDRFMVMPVGPLLFVLTLDAATHAFGTLLTGSVIIARASSELNLNWNVFNVVILVLMVGCGTMIYVAVNLITATLSFWFVGSRTSIMFVVQRFRDFASYPLPIYAMPIQVLLTWIIPFAFTGFFPATFFLEQREFSAYVYSIPLVSVGFLGLAYAFWRTGLNVYQSTGS